MAQLSYRRHRFPPEIIQHAIWLYLRFTLSYRDLDELLAERGLDISYETVRRWGLNSAPRSRDGCASVGLCQAIAGIWTRWWCGYRGSRMARQTGLLQMRLAATLIWSSPELSGVIARA